MSSDKPRRRSQVGLLQREDEQEDQVDDQPIVLQPESNLRAASNPGKSIQAQAITWPVGSLVNTWMMITFSYLNMEYFPSFGTFYVVILLLLVELWRSGVRRVNRSASTKLMWILNVSRVVAFILLIPVIHSTIRLAVLDHFDDVEFTRLGLITDTTAKVFVRYPPPASESVESIFVIYLFFRPQHSAMDTWGPYVQVILTGESDWTAASLLTDLTPDTQYEFMWKSGPDTSSDIIEFSPLGRRFAVVNYWQSQIGLSSPVKPAGVKVFRLQTASPRGKPTQFTFTFGSCIRPNFPYGQDIPGVGFMASHESEFFISLGDFIYTDATTVFEWSLRQTRRLYRQTFGNADMMNLLGRTALIGTIDDHEFANDWDNGTEPEKYQNGIKPFIEYMGVYDQSASDSLHSGVYFTFERGNVGFFIMDTRSFRRRRDENYRKLAIDSSERTMLGKEQKKKLFRWLLDVKETHPFKIIASSVPFTFNFWNQDTWYGYQSERQEIVDFINKHRITGVIFVSGDRHQVGITRMKFKASPIEIFDFSVSPVNQFNPPFNYFFETSNIKGLIHPTNTLMDYFLAQEPFPVIDGIRNPHVNKAFPNSSWLRDETLYYRADSGRMAFGKIIIDTRVGDKSDCPAGKNHALYLCVFVPGVESQDASYCHGPGELLYKQVVCV